MTTGRSSATSPGNAAYAHLTLELALAHVACVTADEDLVAALRTAVPGTSIVSVATPNALAELLLAGECGVLAIDVPELGPAAVTVIAHLASQFPDLPIIGIGDRSDELTVAHLISTGEVYRFLHRPISAARARTFIEAALRRHQELRAAANPRPPPPPPPALVAEPDLLDAPGATAAPRLEAWTGPTSGLPLVGGLAALLLVVLGLGLAMLASHQPAAPALHPARTGAPLPAAAPTAPAVAAATRPPAGVLAAAASVARGAAPPARAAAVPAPPAATAATAAPAATPVAAPPAPLAPPPTATAPLAPPPAATAPAATPPAPTPAVTPGAEVGDAPAAPAPAPRHRAAPPVRILDAAPDYPDGARDVGLEGWVDVHFTVNAAGEPEAIRVVGADPVEVFEEAALAAVRRWRYDPPPAPAEVDARVEFKLH